MPVNFTGPELQKIHDAMVESNMKFFTFQSGHVLRQVDVGGVVKWQVEVEGYPATVYDTLGQGFQKAREIEFRMMAL